MTPEIRSRAARRTRRRASGTPGTRRARRARADRAGLDAFKHTRCCADFLARTGGGPGCPAHEPQQLAPRQTPSTGRSAAEPPIRSAASPAQAVWQPLGVIDAHRPAHNDQTARVIPVRRDGISFVNAHVPGRQPLRAEGMLDRAERLGRNVLHHQNCAPVRVTRAHRLALLEAGGLVRAAGGVAGAVTSATVMFRSMAACKSTWSDPMPAVTASLSLEDLAIRSAVK